ncbi:MAG: hypothetical protein ABIK09_00580 [Pseudomonadota bacterium]
MRLHLLLTVVAILGLLVPGAGCGDRRAEPGRAPRVESRSPEPEEVVAVAPPVDGPRGTVTVTDTGEESGSRAPRLGADTVSVTEDTVAVTTGEALEAKPEGMRRRPTPPKIAHLVTVADLVGVLGVRGWVSEGPIPGISPEGHYNSTLYTRPGSTHMVGVTLWEYRQHRDAVARWNELLVTHPNAEATDAVVKDTFFWTRASIAGLVFLEADRSRVVGVSCHTELCNDTQLLQLATIAHGRAR